MKQNKLFLGLATMFAAAFAFTSCSSDDAESQTQKVDQNRTIRLVSTLEKGGTRSTTDPQSGTSLSTSSNLAIWAINTTADPDETLENGNNEQYSVDGNGNLTPKTATNTMTWPEGATLDFYAYAPYNSGYSYNAANGFSVQADQSTEADYLASDLVLARATGKTYDAQTPVALSFNHMLSKVNITIKEDANSNVDLANAVVSITNTLPTTTFNPSTGELGVASGEVTEITAATIAADLVEGDATSTATACAVVVPQNLAAETAFVKIVTAGEDSKTLIGKLSAATTLEGGNSYSMTISVGEITEPVTIVDIELSSATLVQWTDNTIGLTAYGVGDYVLKDGTIVKNGNLTNAQKSNVIAVIFSTTVSTTDATAGYNAYAMGVSRIGASGGTKKQWYVNTSYNLGAANLADGFADLDGLSKTTQIKQNSTYTALETNTEHIANLDNYSLTINDGVTNLSGWFTPSFGQLIAILNNLGDAGITSSIAKEFKNNSSFYINSDNTTWANTEQGGITISTVLDKINAYTTAAGKGNILALGNVDLGTVTENTSESANGQKFWMFALKDSGDWELTAAQAKVGGTGVKEVCVIPVVAVKLPAVAQ